MSREVTQTEGSRVSIQLWRKDNQYHGGQGWLGRALAGHKTTPVSSLIRQCPPVDSQRELPTLVSAEKKIRTTCIPITLYFTLDNMRDSIPLPLQRVHRNNRQPLQP